MQVAALLALLALKVTLRLTYWVTLLSNVWVHVAVSGVVISSG